MSDFIRLSTSKSEVVVLKVYFVDERGDLLNIRKFAVRSFYELCRDIRDVVNRVNLVNFRVEVIQRMFRFRYFDMEKDWIDFSSEQEFKLLKRVHTSTSEVRVKVYKNMRKQMKSMKSTDIANISFTNKKNVENKYKNDNVEKIICADCRINDWTNFERYTCLSCPFGFHLCGNCFRKKRLCHPTQHRFELTSLPQQKSNDNNTQRVYYPQQKKNFIFPQNTFYFNPSSSSSKTTTESNCTNFQPFFNSEKNFNVSNNNNNGMNKRRKDFLPEVFEDDDDMTDSDIDQKQEEEQEEVKQDEKKMNELPFEFSDEESSDIDYREVGEEEKEKEILFEFSDDDEEESEEEEQQQQHEESEEEEEDVIQYEILSGDDDDDESKEKEETSYENLKNRVKYENELKRLKFMGFGDQYYCGGTTGRCYTLEEILEKHKGNIEKVIRDIRIRFSDPILFKKNRDFCSRRKRK